MWRLLPLLLALSACNQVPAQVEPVSPFQLDKYLGEWVEIARLDHRFERGLTEVTAHYSLREDGGLKVVNRGYDAKKNEWNEAIGKAYFVDDTNTGQLKVSFFGPFYGGYNIAKLDDDYTMALIIGPSLDYAWILARAKNPEHEVCDAYVAEAEKIGITTANWMWIQECRD